MTSVYNHVGIRVSSIERSAAFYEAVLGAKVVLGPWPFRGATARAAMDGEERAGQVAVIGFGEGFIELFELPGAPGEPLSYVEQSLLHFAATVDDVPAAVERVRANGGSVVFEPTPVGSYLASYVRDPDGTTFELLDAPFSSVIEAIRTRLEAAAGQR